MMTTEKDSNMWDGPFVVAVLNSNHTVSIVDGSILYENEREARSEANRLARDKPFMAFVPWPVPHMKGRKKYSCSSIEVQS